MAVVVTDYRLQELACGEWRVAARPERITPQAAEIFGYDPELWAKAPPIRQVFAELIELLPPNHVVVPAGQNVRMDVQFLEKAFKACDIPYPFDYHVIDLATLFYAWSLVNGQEVSALSLRQAATTAGLLEGGTPHRALADTRLTLDTFRHYIGALAPRDPSEPLPLPPADKPAEGPG